MWKFLTKKTDFICLANLEGQWQSTRTKLNLFRTCIYYLGDLESCYSPAKVNFTRATFWKFGASVVAHEKICVNIACTIKADLITKQKRNDIVCSFILLLIMFFEMLFICHRHGDPDRFLHLLHTLWWCYHMCVGNQKKIHNR